MFQVTRKQFLDRLMSGGDLRDLGEMLLGWSCVPRLGSPPRGWGSYRLEARVAGFARQESQQVRAMLAGELTGFGVQITEFDADTIAVAGPQMDGARSFDVGMWAQLLAAPVASGSSLMLRLEIRGGDDAIFGTGTPGATFVLFGLAQAGEFLLKAVWAYPIGKQPDRIFTHAQWPPSSRLIEALKVYQQAAAMQPLVTEGPLFFRCASAGEAGTAARALRAIVGPATALGVNADSLWAHAPAGSCAQAVSYARFFRGKQELLFMTPRAARTANWIARMWAEFPEDRTPRAFAVRLGVPLIAGTAALTAGLQLDEPGSPVPRALLLSLAVALFALAIRIVVKKFLFIARVRQKMESGFRKLYLQASAHEPVDLAALGLTMDPSFMKYSLELEAAGGQHLGDFRIVCGHEHKSGYRMYRLPADHSILSLIFLKEFGELKMFPAKPILSCTTRFRDGHRHGTTTGKGDRKSRLPRTTATCIRNAGPEQILAAHRATVQRLIAQGHEPLDPPADASVAIAADVADFEEARAFYRNRSTYSWSDAAHWAFEVTRRQYRPIEASASSPSIA